MRSSSSTMSSNRALVQPDQLGVNALLIRQRVEATLRIFVGGILFERATDRIECRFGLLSGDLVQPRRSDEEDGIFSDGSRERATMIS